VGRGKAERGPNACARGRLSAYPQVLQPVGQQLHIRLRGPALGLDLDHHARALRRIAEDLVRQIGRLRFRRRLRCLCHGAGKPTLKQTSSGQGNASRLYGNWRCPRIKETPTRMPLAAARTPQSGPFHWARILCSNRPRSLLSAQLTSRIQDPASTEAQDGQFKECWQKLRKVLAL